jgi:CotH kinase protein/Lamin Tail Domain
MKNPLSSVAKTEAQFRHHPATRRLWSFGIAASLALVVLGWARPAAGQFAITEFMAANNVTLNDENGENSDWIEIQNQGASSASLAGWFLTDTTNNLVKWSFPATNLPPSGFIVVFASENNRRTPGAPLHTNFRLSAGGEYLALVAPDGTNIVSQFAPVFPRQVADVSYGVVRGVSTVTLLGAGAPGRAFVPLNDNLGLTWTDVEFNDAAWTNGTMGLGYDRQPLGVNFLPLIGLNVEAMLYPNYGSLYTRVPFTVANPGDLSGLTLRMKFEDGFVAYLNGQEIARSNAPANAMFNSVALGPRTDTAATNFLDFDVSASRGFLVAGTNLLSFHVLNNPTNSPDLLLLPQLDGVTPNGPPLARYFPVPTPGRANNSGVATVGPVISDEQHTPAEPRDGDNLMVTARLRPAFAPVASATLRYRVMFGGEVSVPLLDDGAHGDGAAADGLYGASIPASASTPGQMVRWYITATDTTGTNVSRYPAFVATNDSPAYFGTVVINPALTNALPVFHWFVQDVGATDTTTGTRASAYWNGEFYDNVFCRVRGASAVNFAKKPYKFDFNPGEHFRFQPGQPRVDELNLNATHQDKTYLRAPLAYETYREAGVPACDAFNVRVQQNNGFFSVAVFTEQVDETFLERRGLDPNGALYKLYQGITSSTSGVEKKTRQNENNADLQAVVDGLAFSNPNRAAFIFDNFDVPEIINYLAAGIVSQDFDRMVKNIYLYRDTQGTRLWTMFPWDKDLTFGVCALQCDTISGNIDTDAGAPCNNGAKSHPLVGTRTRNFVGHVNNLFDAVYGIPVTKEIFLRRLRTLMDAQLQPPGTSPGQRLYEQRLDELARYLQPDATLDLARWQGAFGQPQTLTSAIGLLKTNYLAQRRVHLYQTHSVDNTGLYPAAAGIPHAQLGSPVLTFGAIEFNPASSNQTQEYIELLNPNPVAVDISGWRLEGGVDFVFAPGTVVPSNGRVYVSPNLAAFRTRTTGPRAGQGLLVVGPYSGQLPA